MTEIHAFEHLHAEFGHGAGSTKGGQPLLAGIGWNPEDLHSNPIKWQLLGEVGWRAGTHAITDIGAWVDGYVGRRYAPAEATPDLRAAWRILLDAVYGGDRTEQLRDDDAGLSGAATTTGEFARLASARDAPRFSKDGFCRMPSFGYSLWTSRNVSGVVEAWRLLLRAARHPSSQLDARQQPPRARDGVTAEIAAYSYDLVDVTRQALQDRFSLIYRNMSASCSPGGRSPPPSPPPVPRPPPGQPVSWVQHAHSNCNGQCLGTHSSGPHGGNCDRIPGCGHDAGLPFCERRAMEARCDNVSQCTCFNTNGYFYSGGSVTPFHAYNLTSYTISGGGVPPLPPPPPPPVPFSNPACVAALDVQGSAILEIGQDLERLLATDEHFLLGRWISAARQWGNTTQEQDWLEWNARMQVTLWGSLEANNAAISDYASKQWSGLVGSYHLPLWKAWLAKMKTAASAGAKTAPDVSLELVQQAEKWVNSTSPTFPTSPSGEDSVGVSLALYEKWVGALG
eukprot:COSAG01_NODE_2269_length_8033_cov_30.452609_1_plen_510_part_00